MTRYIRPYDKIDKVRAGYIEHMDEGMQRCCTCEMYSSGSCDLVMGIIEPYGGCKFYEQALWVAEAVLERE